MRGLLDRAIYFFLFMFRSKVQRQIMATPKDVAGANEGKSCVSVEDQSIAQVN